MLILFLAFLSKIDETKATGLDRIPSKLLKMAASIVAPSLTSIFQSLFFANSLQNAVPRMFADDINRTLSAKTLTELELASAPALN